MTAMVGQHISVLFSRCTGVLAFAFALLVCAVTFAATEPPATLTILANPLTRQVLSIQPGFTLFVVFDAPIDFVAVGDEQMLTVAVRGPGGVVALKATQRAGRTNLHIQAAGVLMVFEVRVVSGVRTADVVRVVTAGKETRPMTVGTTLAPIQPPGQPLTSATTAAAGPTPPQPDEKLPQPSASEASPAQGKLRGNLGTFLADEEMFRVQEVTQSGIRATFQAYRTPGGVEIRYHLANLSGIPWQVLPRRMLVRADGKIILPHILHRFAPGDGVMLPSGATETGLLALGKRAATVELLFPLFPPVPRQTQPPLVFEVRFTDLEALLEVKPGEDPHASYRRPGHDR